MAFKKAGFAMVALLYLSACAELPTTAGGPVAEPDNLDEVPPELFAAAAPHQDLTAVRIQPEDGCYWYRWVGPVETTYLPVRTTDGRQICARG